MPAISESDRSTFADDWKEFLKGNPASGLNIPIKDWDLNDPHGWWWLFTKESLVSFCELVGFEVMVCTEVSGGREVLIHAKKDVNKMVKMI